MCMERSYAIIPITTAKNTNFIMSIYTAGMAPQNAEKPRRASQDYLCFDDGIRHLLAISSAQD